MSIIPGISFCIPFRRRMNLLIPSVIALSLLENVKVYALLITGKLTYNSNSQIGIINNLDI